jgi:hypothetical protein
MSTSQGLVFVPVHLLLGSRDAPSAEVNLRSHGAYHVSRETAAFVPDAPRTHGLTDLKIASPRWG